MERRIGRRKSRSNLQPMQQGHLDCLCGLYALLNAVQWCLGPGMLRAEDYEWLATELFQELDREGLLLRAVEYGILTPALIRLIRHTEVLLRTWWPVSLIISRPWHQRRWVHRDLFRDRIARHLTYSDTAVIIATEGLLSHWTVATGVTDTGLRLFDSMGRKRLGFGSDGRMIGLPTSTTWITPSSTIMMRVMG